MDEEIDVSVTVEQLKEAGSDVSQQIPALLELGEWYLKKAKKTSKGADFTKANALYNAALARSRSVNHEISEDQILVRIVETYREFLNAFAKDEEDAGEDAIKNEINSHKEFLVNERSIFQQRVDEIDSCFHSNDKTEEQYQIHAEQVHEVFRDIQDMYRRLVSMLAKECESRLGQPPCDYAIIALGSVARMEATPFSDLEFAILYADPAIGDKINYFRVLTHFLHLKVINLGETILPALAIEQLNDFQSSDPSDNWFYDSETPRGISFDGAMPWASKTALGRMKTKSKPALELIRTPEEMAEFQDEEIAVKEGYHLADIMSRVTLLFGDKALIDEYNERVADKLNTKLSAVETVGFHRGVQQMMFDLGKFNPFHTFLGSHIAVGGLFDAKKQLYRLMSLLLSDLGMVFDIRSSTPWQISKELQSRGIFGESETANIKVCLSIANKIRLKTYFVNKGQKELFSPVPNTTEESGDSSLFQDLGEDVVVHLLSNTNDIFERCHKLSAKLVQQGELDIGILRNPSVVSSKTALLGTLYFRLQNFPKALEWYKLEPKDSPEYSFSLNEQGTVHLEYEEYEESIKCFEKALEVHHQNEGISTLDVFACTTHIALTLLRMGKCEKARSMLEKAISEHDKIYGKGCPSVNRGNSMQILGGAYFEFGDMRSALETFRKVEQICTVG